MEGLSNPSALFQIAGSYSMDRTCSEGEWQTRVDLAACYRLVEHYGMADMIANHISARVPGHENHYLLNPFGMMYEEITASSLIKVDLEGNIISNSNPDYGINLAGYVIHWVFNL